MAYKRASEEVYSESLAKKKQRKWADDEELDDMEICHPERIELMKKIMGRVPGLSFDYALEAACGDARLSKDLLVKKFKNIDLFDIDEEAIETAKEWSKNFP
jgi:hypothetical protein